MLDSEILPNRPKVSTVIAAFNAERTIAETINSALAQEWENHEILVIDDGSTDRTATILEGFADRIRVKTQCNSGAAAARNLGARCASGKYVAFLDSDDYWVPDKLMKMVPALEANPEASLAFSEYLQIDDSNISRSSLCHAPSAQEMMTSLPAILTSTWVLPKARFDEAGGFDSEFRGGQGFEDSWLLVRLRELGRFIYFSEPLTAYRVSGTIESADKYRAALRTFVSLALRRYGRTGRPLARAARNLQCRWLLTKAAHQMSEGDRVGAIATLARIIATRPAYFAGAQFRERLLKPQNMRRLRELATLGSQR